MAVTNFPPSNSQGWISPKSGFHQEGAHEDMHKVHLPELSNSTPVPTSHNDRLIVGETSTFLVFIISIFILFISTFL